MVAFCFLYQIPRHLPLNPEESFSALYRSVTLSVINIKKTNQQHDKEIKTYFYITQKEDLQRKGYWSPLLLLMRRGKEKKEFLFGDSRERKRNIRYVSLLIYPIRIYMSFSLLSKG